MIHFSFCTKKYRWAFRMQWQSESKINKYLYMKINGYREKRNAQRKIAQCGMATFIWQFKGNIKHSTSCSNATISYLVAEIESGFKIIHPKYSKYWPLSFVIHNEFWLQYNTKSWFKSASASSCLGCQSCHRRELKTVPAQIAEITKCHVIFIVFFIFEIRNDGGDGFNQLFMVTPSFCIA